jgi:hypothetical protein
MISSMFQTAEEDFKIPCIWQVIFIELSILP